MQIASSTSPANTCSQEQHREDTSWEVLRSLTCASLHRKFHNHSLLKICSLSLSLTHTHTHTSVNYRTDSFPHLVAGCDQCESRKVSAMVRQFAHNKDTLVHSTQPPTFTSHTPIHPLPPTHRHQPAVLQRRQPENQSSCSLASLLHS